MSDQPDDVTGRRPPVVQAGGVFVAAVRTSARVLIAAVRRIDVSSALRAGARLISVARPQARSWVAEARWSDVAAGLRGGSVMAVTVGLVGWVVVSSVGPASIPVHVAGRIVELGGPAPVRLVLREAGARLRFGVLRTASGRVLDPRWSRPTIFVNDRRVTSGRVIRNATRIRVVPGRDAVEPALVRIAGAAFGGLPDVERDLWNPGSGGQVVEVVGARSGEVERRFPLTPPTPPSAQPGKTVALTFDDGPDPRYTPRVLEILRASGITATFCVIGFEARAYPSLIGAIHADGHVLCDHTESHPYLDRIPAPAVESQLSSPASYLAQLVGQGPAFVRAPYGALNATVIAIAHRQGLRVLGWSVDPGDYQRPPAATIVSRVLSQVHPGAIVLLHDGGGDRSKTVAALPSIIAALRGQGYTFVPPVVGDAGAPPGPRLVTGVRLDVPRPPRPRAPGPSRTSRHGSRLGCSPAASRNRCRLRGP